MPKNIISDGILHVNIFYYFKISYFTCTFFTKKFIYNEYIEPYFFIAPYSTIFVCELFVKNLNSNFLLPSQPEIQQIKTYFILLVISYYYVY